MELITAVNFFLINIVAYFGTKAKLIILQYLGGSDWQWLLIMTVKSLKIKGCFLQSNLKNSFDHNGCFIPEGKIKL